MVKIDDATSQAVRTIVGEMMAYFMELEGESPRAAAILAVAALEDELTSLLRSKFPNATNAQWKRIAGPGPTPFGSIEAKRNVAEAFGFIGPKTRTMIKKIAEIRNKFAHRTEVRSFGHPLVLDLCRELSENPVNPYTLVKNVKENDVRYNYINTVKDLTERLSEIRYYAPELDEKPPEPLP